MVVLKIRILWGLLHTTLPSFTATKMAEKLLSEIIFSKAFHATYFTCFTIYTPMSENLSVTVQLQWVFRVLIGFFERDGIRTNVANTLAMVCPPVPIYGRYPDAYYGQWMTVEGDPHHVNHHWRVMCGQCVAEVVMASIAAHIQTQHGRSGWERPLPHPLIYL